MAAEISGPVFILHVGTDPDAGVVRLRLTDEHGNRQLGANQVRLAEHRASQWQGLFDTRAYVDRYAKPDAEADLLEQIGVFLGETVLGPEIMKALSAGISQRSLLVRQAAAPEDDLAAAFARVPWEIARPAAGQKALFERNLGVRMELSGASPDHAPRPSDEPLRVLLVYAEAPASRPLAMRLEREQLLDLFHDKVMPGRQVSVDVLCHGVLDIAYHANLALKRWEACLSVLTEIEEIQRGLGEGELELARTRSNRTGPLVRLGRLDEAQQVLERCLSTFREAGDLPAESKVLLALAGLWDERGDPEQAVDLQRKALAVCNRHSNLEDRSISHGNLAEILDRLGASEEAARHRLAAIVYHLVMGHGQFLARQVCNLAISMRQAAASGESYELPRLAELLARPEFEPLQRTLTERNVGPDELQAGIDEIIEEVRRRVAESPEGTQA